MNSCKILQYSIKTKSDESFKNQTMFVVKSSLIYMCPKNMDCLRLHINIYIFFYKNNYCEYTNSCRTTTFGNAPEKG